jgi:hypothetical protein
MLRFHLRAFVVPHVSTATTFFFDVTEIHRTVTVPVTLRFILRLTQSSIIKGASYFAVGPYFAIFFRNFGPFSRKKILAKFSEI